MASHATLGVITYMIIHAKLPELPGRQISGDVWFRHVSSNDYIPTSLPVLHRWRILVRMIVSV